MSEKLRVFLVDDEPLALKRLSRMLCESGKIEIAGQASEPLKALQAIPKLELDAVFLDIQMPELTGFELLQKLETYPPVIFTTAFDEFALKAFEVYSVDYLLKPVEEERLARTLVKLEKIVAGKTAKINRNLLNLLDFVNPPSILERVSSRIGAKVRILDVNRIVCFFSEDKTTFAQTAEGKKFPVSYSLNELEQRLDKKNFLRVHRRAIVNANFIDEVHGWFGGKVKISLKNQVKTEIIVARDRLKTLRDFLGM